MKVIAKNSIEIPKIKGWKILNYMDYIIEDESPIIAFELGILSLKYKGIFVYHISRKCMEIYQKFSLKNIYLEMLLEESLKSNVPVDYVSRIAQELIIKKYINKSNFDKELKILYTLCQNQQSERFISKITGNTGLSIAFYHITFWSKLPSSCVALSYWTGLIRSSYDIFIFLTRHSLPAVTSTFVSPHSGHLITGRK